MTTDPHLIEAYFHLCEQPHPHRHPRDQDPAFDRVQNELTRLIDEDPERGWEILLDLIEAAPSDELLDMIGAGPLEDFMHLQGPQFVDRIEESTRRDSRFRRAMSGVILEGCDPELQRRIRILLGPVPNEPSP